MICPACFLETFDNGSCSSCGFDESTPQSPLLLPPGTALMNGQYLVGKLLGKPGGFGITYLGWDSQLATFVAVKEYLPRDVAGRHFDRMTVSAHTQEDAEHFRYGLEQFLLEARTLAQFDHPNVVRVRSFFQENGTAYLVMDYLEGNSLHDHLLNIGGRMSEKSALDIMIPILDGLREVHAKGFLHRDIKPQNIYITTAGRPILLDFGTARQSLGERNRGMTTIITPGYAPWEQYHRHGKQGPWTDIYACAATLYHLTTGIVPPEAAERVAQESLLPPLQLCPELSSQINFAILQALSIDPANRPQNAAQFQEALKGKGISALQPNAYPPPVPPPAWSPPPPPIPQPQPPFPPPSFPLPPSNRGKKVFLWIAAVLVVLLGGLAFSYNSMNGYKTLAHNSGTYEGTVSWGTPSGKGKLTFADGSVYTGDFSGGLRHGKGVLRAKSGSIYDGEWKNDKFDGAGTLTFPSGARYEGSFKEGKRNGTGTQVNSDGRQYTGAWKNDKANGSGVLTTKDGTKFTGIFKDDLPHGEGSYTTTRGDQYLGNFDNGKKSGQGTYTFADGRIYKGTFSNDKRNGQGTMKWTSGNQYVGEWKDDQRHGKGTQTLTNNGIIIADYVGDYQEDVPYSPNGQYRIVLKKDGRIVIASYRNGSFYW